MYYRYSDNSGVIREVEKTPRHIERNKVSREKFGVTWDKLADEYRRIVSSECHCEKNMNEWKIRMIPFFNPDGTRIKQKLTPHGVACVIGISALITLPFITLWFDDVRPFYWYRLTPLVVAGTVSTILRHVYTPRTDIKWNPMWHGFKSEPEFIRNQFHSMESTRQRLVQLKIDKEPLKSKFDEVDAICGGNSSSELEYEVRDVFRQTMLSRFF